MRILWFILSPLIALAVGLFFLGLARKFLARTQWRYGPPIYQPLIDILRFFTQKSVSHGAVFDLGVILSLAGSFIVVLFLPFGGICPLQSSGGLLVILYMMLLAPLGLALTAGEAANPNSSIGVSRMFTLALGYEVPLLLVVLAVMARYDTISIVEIVAAQREGVSNLATFPLVLAGIAYIMILPALLGLRPFDVMQAPQEISSGPLAELGGRYLALAQLQHAVNMFIVVSLFVNLMWGGSSNVLIFLLKMIAVLLFVLWINASFPRLRIDQAIRYLWRWPTLIAFLGLLLVEVMRK